MTTIITHPFATPVNLGRDHARSTKTTARHVNAKASAGARLCTRLEHADASSSRFDAFVHVSLAVVAIAWPAYECIRAILAY